MTRQKSELYCLVAELRAARWSTPAIARQLRVTTRRVQQVLADLTEPPTPLEQLPHSVRERIAYFAKRNEIQADTIATN